MGEEEEEKEYSEMKPTADIILCPAVITLRRLLTKKKPLTLLITQIERRLRRYAGFS